MVAIHRIHKDIPTEVARWATVLFIVFMLVIAFSPYLSFSIAGGRFTAYIKEWLFLVMAAFIVIQFDETARRRSNDMAGFFKDNTLAFAALLVGILVFAALWMLPRYTLTPDQFHIMLQCTVWASVDFVFGLVFALRIAFAGKEREEDRPSP